MTHNLREEKMQKIMSGTDRDRFLLQGWKEARRFWKRGLCQEDVMKEIRKQRRRAHRATSKRKYKKAQARVLLLAFASVQWK